MKPGILIGILCFSLYSIAAFAQSGKKDTAFKTIVSNVSVDSVYNKTIDYLQESGYFIVSLDKQSGFIQAKLYISSRSLSNKIGDKRTLNFILRPIDKNQSKIVLNIYNEEFAFFPGNGAYCKEAGISSDKSLYKTILDGLEKYLTQQ